MRNDIKLVVGISLLVLSIIVATVATSAVDAAGATREVGMKPGYAYDSSTGQLTFDLDISDVEIARGGGLQIPAVYYTEVYDKDGNRIHLVPHNPIPSKSPEGRQHTYVNISADPHMIDLSPGEYCIYIKPWNGALDTFKVSWTVKILTSITVDKDPTKLKYYTGESFDPAGIVVTAHYSDGTSANVSSLITYPKDALSLDDTSVRIAYKEGSVTCTADVGITVIQLTKIDITTEPTKTSYKAGERFSTAGMVVKATFSDGSTAVVTDYVYSPTGPLSTTDTAITVSYTKGDTTKTTSQPITVTPEPTPPGPTPTKKMLESISVTTQPDRTIYDVGESFDPSGMVITAEFSDGSKAVVRDYTYQPSGALNESDTSITVTYTYNGVSKTASVPITVAKGIVPIDKEEEYWASWDAWTRERQTGYGIRDGSGNTTYQVTVKKTSEDGTTASGTSKYTLDADGRSTDFEYTITYNNPDRTETTVYGKGNADSAVLTVSGSSERDVLDAIDSMHGYYSRSVRCDVPSDSSGEAVLNGTAIKALANAGYSLRAYGDKMSLEIDATVVKGIADAGGHDIRLIVVEATPEMKTEEQDRVITTKYSVKVALLVDGVEVHGLYGGTARVEIEPGFNALYVYYVAENGDVEDIPSSYDAKTGILDFAVTHVSIYMITAEKYVPAGDDGCWWIWILFILILLLLLLLILFILFRKLKITLDLDGKTIAIIPEGWEAESETSISRRFARKDQFIIPYVEAADGSIPVGWLPDPPAEVKKSETLKAVWSVPVAPVDPEGPTGIRAEDE